MANSHHMRDRCFEHELVTKSNDVVYYSRIAFLILFFAATICYWTARINDCPVILI